MTARPADVCVSGSGSVFLLSLLTGAAREWVDQHVSPDRQFFGDDLAVEWRFAAALAAGMEADGLVVTDGEVQP